MTAMYRGLVHVSAWSLATGASVTLSWWGVHTVMAGTAYDPPRALPITAAGSTQEARALARPTSRPPKPAHSPSPSRTSKAPAPSGTPGAASSPPSSSSGDSGNSSGSSAHSSKGSPPASSGEVKGYDTDGGRVVFDIGDTSATLVSATPGAGWSMQVWKTESWIRVEFTSGADKVSVFCTWHDGPPHVDIGTY
ncbi:hypothetical protein B0E37_00337 [Streptomyces sp. MH192]|nr:hypothetical protein [Streptomyces sp. MH192]MCF0098138.1 hypothetical protein [Streptomyces sp. MH191]